MAGPVRERVIASSGNVFADLGLPEAEELDTRVAFAAACAERLLPSYERFYRNEDGAGFAALRKFLARLWDDLEGSTMSVRDVEAAIEQSMKFMPGEDDGSWKMEWDVAEDAVAVAYARKCRGDGQAKYAVWAARRAYEALDAYVIASEDIDPIFLAVSSACWPTL